MTDAINIMRPQRFSKTLDQIFSSQKPAPVAVSFIYSMLSSNRNGNHVATIIGRKFNSKTNQCEYIIRDSYGDDCKNNYKYNCEGGNIFVPEDILVNRAQDLVWLPR